MTDYTITDEQRAAVRSALLSPDLVIGSGVGDATVPGQGEACTIAEINLVLTGRLDDGPHPCISEVVRRWVVCVQDAMPATVRNGARWRQAAVGIAGSAAGAAAERARLALVLDWMWDALADEAVIAALPVDALPAWRTMLAEKTTAAANAAYAAAYAAATYAANAAAAAAAAAATAATYATYAVNAATYAANAAADADAVDAYAADAYWERRDPAALLAKLIEVTA